MLHGISNDESNIYVFQDENLIDTIFVPIGGIGDIIVTSEGELIVSTTLLGTGIYNAATERWNWRFQPYRVWSKKEHPNGTVTFGTSASLVVYDSGTWQTFDVTNSPIGDKSIHTHFVDSQGNIYVGYKGGIYKYDGTEWEYIHFFTQYKDGILSMYEDEIGNFWLGTFNSGLLYWNGFSYQQYDIMNSAIPSNEIKEIYKHPNTDDLWMITKRGLAVFDRDEFTYRKGIFGKTYYDADKNMSFDSGQDVGIKNTIITLDENISTLTDQNGNYSFYPSSSNVYEIECIYPEEYTPTNITKIDTLFVDDDILDLSFGLWKEIAAEELKIDIVLSPFVCSSHVSAWITLENPGWKTAEGKATFTLAPDIKILSTTPEAEIIGDNSVSWDFESLSYLESRTFIVVIEGPSIDDILSQDVSLEDASINIDASIELEGLTQSYSESAPFLCAYDPNDKLAMSDGPSVDNYSLLENDLVYTIRFQNEGNYKATNVVLTDTLSSHLDLNSLEIISSSHLVQTQINRNREVVFRFQNINLPPKSENEAESQGFVKFRISPNEGLLDNTLVNNTAYIYFDNNSPIVTNVTENILVEELPTTSADAIEKTDWQVQVYPNPSEGHFQLSSSKDKFDYAIYDVSGQLILKDSNNGRKLQFRLETSGIFFLIANDANETRVIKIVSTN